MVAIILRTLFRGICQVCVWATIPVSVSNGDIPKPEGAGCKVCVGTLYSEHGPLYDSLSRLTDVAPRRDLREKVLGVSTNTRVLVRADDSDIPFVIDAGKKLSKTGNNGTPDSSVSESYV